MSKPIDVAASDFDSVVLKSTLPVLVDFWAPWCGPCRMMAPVLDQLAEELAGKLIIAKMNVDGPENVRVAQQYQIMSIPNLKLFKNGSVVQEFVGLRPKDVLREELAKEL